MFTGYDHIKDFLRRSASVDIDKSDMKRLSDLIGGKLYDLLVIGCAMPITTTATS